MCRRVWLAEGQDLSYETLTELAVASQPLASLIDPADPRFLRTGDMPRMVADFCRETGQAAPSTSGQFVRCVLESLALSYRRTIEEIEEVTGKPITRLHIVGGGTKNLLLNQFAANAIGREVITGPVEATAIGNLLMQAMALGHIQDLAAGRRVIRASFPMDHFQPTAREAWDAAYRRFRSLAGQAKAAAPGA